MSTIQGLLKGIYNNETYDTITVEAEGGQKHYINLKAGTANPLVPLKGRKVIVKTNSKEFNGKEVHWTTPPDVKATAGATQQGTMTSTFTEDRQASIVYQSMSKVAIEFAIHNAKLRNEEVTLETLHAITEALAKKALNPSFNASKLESKKKEQPNMSPPDDIV